LNAENKVAGDSVNECVPLGPSQELIMLGAMEMLVEVASGHELVNEQEGAAAAIAPAQQPHNVSMSQPGYDVDLGLELLPPLRGRIRREHLDGDVARAIV
jgi:hypothetical protein